MLFRENGLCATIDLIMEVSCRDLFSIDRKGEPVRNGEQITDNAEPINGSSSCDDSYEDVFYACESPFYDVYVFCRLA